MVYQDRPAPNRKLPPNNLYVKMRQEERAAAAIALVRDGKTVGQAAAEMAIRPETFVRLVKAALQRNAVQDAQEYRAIHMERLEFLWSQLVPEIAKGNAYSIKVAIDVLKRQSQLLGLDAPVVINVRRLAAQYAEKYGLDMEERRDLFREIKQSLTDARRAANHDRDLVAVPNESLDGIIDPDFMVEEDVDG
jgi:hypothetical protein